MTGLESPKKPLSPLLKPNLKCNIILTMFCKLFSTFFPLKIYIFGLEFVVWPLDLFWWRIIWPEIRTSMFHFDFVQGQRHTCIVFMTSLDTDTWFANVCILSLTVLTPKRSCSTDVETGWTPVLLHAVREQSRHRMAVVYPSTLSFSLLTFSTHHLQSGFGKISISNFSPLFIFKVKLSKGEICVANVIRPCEWCKTG